MAQIENLKIIKKNNKGRLVINDNLDIEVAVNDYIFN